MTSFFDRLKLGIVAFREGKITSSVIDTGEWSDQDSRRLRYQILWAQYQGNTYRDINSWATAYRKQYGLYKYIRPIYNPAYRLGEFWRDHLFGGQLDPFAADDGAIPIVTENETLRPAIAELWRWSRWQVQKDVLTIRGAILGDVAIQVVDDVVRGKVYLDLLHPGILESIERDSFGNIKGYTIAEVRVHPTTAGTVTYGEIVTREGEDVVYKTYLNGEPFAWPENLDRTGNPVSQWSEPYGFVPLVVIQHNDVGLDWGWSELHPIRSKIQEADGLASQISDAIRKTVDPIWLMKGIKDSVLTLEGASDTANADVPYPGREELQAIWNVPIDGGAEAMIPQTNLAGSLTHLDNILKEIERDVLELSQDLYTASGDASGRALRTARQPIASKVIGRRGNYDAGMVTAQQMAISIGGWRGYDQYKGFNLESYGKGDLEHSISKRQVFEEDPLDQIEIDTAFWKSVQEAKKAGVSLPSFLKAAGWDDKRIEEIMEQEEVDEQAVVSDPNIGEDIENG